MITSFIFQSPQPLPVNRIREQLETLPTVARDRWDGDIYVVTDDAATLRLVRDQRDKNQLGFPRVVTLVRLYESRVDFSLQSKSVETARDFALWMRGAFSFAILDDSFADITSRCDANLDYLFGARLKRPLVPVGFFRELKHGDKSGSSIHESVGATGSLTERRIAVYLREAPILLHAVGPVSDVLNPKGDFICAPNIHTDGVYAWPEDLAFYVERYHVALPQEFLEHLASAKWKVPADVDLANVELR